MVTQAQPNPMRWLKGQSGELHSSAEMFEYLVGSAAFKADGTASRRSAGSIPVHLRDAQYTMMGPPDLRLTPSRRDRSHGDWPVGTIGNHAARGASEVRMIGWAWRRTAPVAVER
jgi:hypothetical protein